MHVSWFMKLEEGLLMAKKRQKKAITRVVDPVKLLIHDLKRVVIWCGISLGVTLVVAFAVDSMT